MTPLRQRMLEDMQLRGLSARTQECYVAAVRQLAAHYHTSPASLTDEQLRHYFLYLTNDKQVARTTATIALCRDAVPVRADAAPWPTLRFVRPAPPTRLPTVLSRDEVRQILALVRIRVLQATPSGGLRYAGRPCGSTVEPPIRCMPCTTFRVHHEVPQAGAAWRGGHGGAGLDPGSLPDVGCGDCAGARTVRTTCTCC
jgi:hypothetical protein